MPVANMPVNADSTLTPGLRAEFVKTYAIRRAAQDQLMAKVMNINITSKRAFEIYAYFKSAAYPSRWDRNTGIPTKAFDSVQFQVPNYRWARRIGWHHDDEQDDQTSSLFQQVQEGGTAFATLDERVFFQILQGSTDPDLLPSVPNAPDGAPLFSATDGDGLDRFGVSGGNILAGVVNPTAQDIRTIYHSVLARITQFLDTEGQPLLDASDIAAGMMIIYGPALTQEMREAFEQRVVLQTTTTPGNLAGAPSNVIIDAGDNVMLWRNPRITNKAIYFCLTSVALKPIFRQNREPVREVPATLDNSDFSRDTYQYYLQWSGRRGYGVALPYAIVKSTN